MRQLKLVRGHSAASPPEKIRRDRRPAESEMRLMFAILEDAVATIVAKHPAGVERNGRARREAIEWMMSEDRVHVFAFDNVCEAVGIDASRLRRGVLEHAGLVPAERPASPASHARVAPSR